MLQVVKIPKIWKASRKINFTEISDREKKNWPSSLVEPSLKPAVLHSEAEAVAGGYKRMNLGAVPGTNHWFDARGRQYRCLRATTGCSPPSIFRSSARLTCDWASQPPDPFAVASLNGKLGREGGLEAGGEDERVLGPTFRLKPLARHKYNLPASSTVFPVKFDHHACLLLYLIVRA